MFIIELEIMGMNQLSGIVLNQNENLLFVIQGRKLAHPENNVESRFESYRRVNLLRDFTFFQKS